MATKFPPKKSAPIEAFLKNQGYTGIGYPRDVINGSHQHDQALKNYTAHEYDGGVVRAQQFDNFYRYTTKTKD